MYDARFSGVLLAVSSLPGPYGSGSLGAPARRFVDFLSEAGQTYWQILPLVPPGHGNSPYMSTSAFAGNPFLIDLDELAAEGLLTRQELEGARRETPDSTTSTAARPASGRRTPGRTRSGWPSTPSSRTRSTASGSP